MKLWKYTTWRPFDSDCPHDKQCDLLGKCYSRDNIINSQLYFNSPKAFNDPFDIAPFLDTTATPKQVRERGLKVIKIHEGLVGKPALARFKELTKIRGINTEKGKKQAVAEQLASLHKSGVCCFSSASSENILMWSHYAEKHTGICLEFAIPSNLKFLIPLKDTEGHPVLQPKPVDYTDNLPQVNLFTNTAEELYKGLTTKSNEWKYEAEYRAMCLNYVGLLPYDPRLLNAVIAGCKMPDKEFEELAITVNKLKYQPHLYRAKKKEREYGFDMERVI